MQRCPIVGVSETTTENEPGRPGDGKVLGLNSTTQARLDRLAVGDDWQPMPLVVVGAPHPPRSDG